MKKKIIGGMSIALSSWLLLCMGLYFLQESLILAPKTLTPQHSFSFAHNIPFTEKNYQFTDNDGEPISLNSLYFEATTPKRKGFVFYLHGNHSTLKKYGNVAMDFTSKGYDIFMFDYRSFGKSTGTIKGEQYFHDDADYLYNTVLAEYQLPADSVVIYGRSLGSGMASHLAANNKAAKLMLETPFFSVLDVAQRRFPFLPVSAFLKYNFRSDLQVPEVNYPVYVFHGTNDWVVAYESAAMFKPMIPPQNFVTIEGGGHDNLTTFPLFHQKLSEFLTQ